MFSTFLTFLAHFDQGGNNVQVIREIKYVINSVKEEAYYSSMNS